MTKIYSPLLRAAFFSAVLCLVKFAAFVQTGSLIILTSFLDSIVDTIVSYLNNRVHAYALKAPDRQHPFGHGGFEVIASLLQGLFIAFSGIFLLFEGVHRLIRPDRAALPDDLPMGIAVMLFSAATGALLSAYLRKHERSMAARNERSLSLTADRGHYTGDFLANIAGAAGLGVIYWTGMPMLDALFGLAGAAGMIIAARPILKQTFRDILHHEVDVELQRRIIELILNHDPRIKGVHRLRTRGLGPSRFIDFHLKLPSDLGLEEAHNIGERVMRTIRREIPRADVSIHLDPDSEPDDDLWDPSYKDARPPEKKPPS